MRGNASYVEVRASRMSVPRQPARARHVGMVRAWRVEVSIRALWKEKFSDGVPAPSVVHRGVRPVIGTLLAEYLLNRLNDRSQDASRPRSPVEGNRGR
jgi:hypothetical protein